MMTSTIAEAVGAYLVRPSANDRVKVQGTQIVDATGKPVGHIREDVAVMLDRSPDSYFDDKFHVMQAGHEEKKGEWQFAYHQQITHLEYALAEKPGVILDVGCGPYLPYRKPANSYLIGLDYSLPSVAANNQVDLKVCASATALPFPDNSVDQIVCLYSIHHMTGNVIKDAEDMMAAALGEFARVLKPNGRCLIYEMTPVLGFGWFERIIWNTAKRLMGAKLDMYFWMTERLSKTALRNGWPIVPEVFYFPSSPWVFFPPVFSLPWLRIPRFLYPLRPVLLDLTKSEP